MERVCTNINFANISEEEFNFYKSVFGGEFSEGGFRRFGDMPPMEGMPPMGEEVKQLVMHVALPIMGDHLLMGSDAPEQMGFKVNTGNNVHISLHPDSREETDRIFNALSEGGKVTMPLADMIWGDYYGSVTDKYGINWMLNHGRLS